jgi:hypothetical protein
MRTITDTTVTRKPSGQFTVQFIDERTRSMKPSILSTGLAFLVLGVALGAWGFVGIVPSPIQIGVGGAMALTGVGLFFRARVAHNVGLAIASGTAGLGGWNLYRALEESQRLGMVKGGVMLAVGLYLLASLALTRAQFRSAAARAKTAKPSPKQ